MTTHLPRRRRAVSALPGPIPTVENTALQSGGNKVRRWVRLSLCSLLLAMPGFGYAVDMSTDVAGTARSTSAYTIGAIAVSSGMPSTPSGVTVVVTQ